MCQPPRTKKKPKAFKNFTCPFTRIVRQWRLTVLMENVVTALGNMNHVVTDIVSSKHNPHPHQ
jgi:hypothetical protein